MGKRRLDVGAICTYVQKSREFYTACTAGLDPPQVTNAKTNPCPQPPTSHQYLYLYRTLATSEGQPYPDRLRPVRISVPY